MQHTKKIKADRSKTSFKASLLALMVLAGSVAHANNYNIEPQPLDSALKSFASQAKVQLMYTGKDVANFFSPGISGNYSYEEVMQRLLIDTRLEYKVVTDNLIVIQPAEGDSKQIINPDLIKKKDSRKDNSRIEEVIVTATKRSASVQDTAISITAIGSTEIERKGLVGLQDYLSAIPGVTMMDWGVGAPRIIMRGLGVSTVAEQSTVSTYLGEIPLANPLSNYSTDMKLVDMDHIEVLRGPQGTLYGGGALGGAVRNIPAAPDLSNLGGKLEVGYSHTSHSENDNSNMVGVINIPLVQDTLGIRVATYRYKNAGYVDMVSNSDVEERAIALGVPARVESDTGSQTYTGARATLLWRPGDKLDVSLMLASQTLEEHGRIDLLTDLGGYQVTGLRTVDDEKKLDKFRVANLVVNYDFDWATFTSATTRYEGDYDDQFDQGRIRPWATYASNDSYKEAVLQDFRVVSELNGPVQFVGGIYYEDFTYHYNSQMIWTGDLSALVSTFGTDDPVGLFNSDFTDRAKHKAFYGELYYSLTDTVKFTVGGRWFDYERLTKSQNSGLFASPSTNLDAGEDGAIFKGGMDYSPTDDVLVYAQWAQGFRLGRGVPQLESRCDADNDGLEDSTKLPFDKTIQESDRTDNYELGSKLSLFDSRMTMNVAIFRIDWTDMPITVQSETVGCSVQTNGGEARSEGVEMEGNYFITPDLQISFSGSYIDAKFSSDNFKVAGVSQNGVRLPMSAKVNGAVGLQYDFEFVDRQAFIRSDLSYVGDYITGFGRDPVGDYYLLNMRAGISFDQFDIEIYGKNLNGGDELITYFTGNRGWRVAPRSLGVNMRYSF